MWTIVNIKPSNSKCMTIVKLIVGFILVCASFLSVGCVTTDATKWLTDSNREFELKHKPDFRLLDNTSINSIFLGKLDNKYIYKIVNNINDDIYLYLPVINNSCAIITKDTPEHVESINNNSTVHFYNKFYLNYNYILQNISLDIKLYNPLHIYIETSSCNNKDSNCFNGTSFIDAKYASKDGVFQNCVHIPSQLTIVDSTILGLRSLGYLITVPVDFALSLTPYKLFTGCGWIWGCP